MAQPVNMRRLRAYFHLLCINQTACFLASLIQLTSSATFPDFPLAAKFTGNDIWRGTPQVRFVNDNRWYTVCSNTSVDYYIAQEMCWHRGFQGVMQLQQGAQYLQTGSEYVSCSVDFVQDTGLYCDALASSNPVCLAALRVVCFLPGYHGCFPRENALPSTDEFYPVVPQQPSSLTLQNCARNCYNLGQAYYGLAFGQTCLCDDFIDPAPAPLNDSSCSNTCAGDRDQRCGGPFALSAYESNLGVCDGMETLYVDQLRYITSENFPNNYPDGSNCNYTFIIDVTEMFDLEVVANYRLGSGDFAELSSQTGFVNLTFSSDSGLLTEYYSDYPIEENVLMFTFKDNPQSRRGSFSVKLHLIPVGQTPSSMLSSVDYGSHLYSSFSYYSSPSLPPSPPSQPPPTGGVPAPASNIALFVGIGVAVVIIIIIVILLITVSILRHKRFRSRPANTRELNSAINATYRRDDERVTTIAAGGKTNQYPEQQRTTSQPPRYVEEPHKYATIEGDYYYAPNIGGHAPQLPQPRARDQTSAPPRDAEYEELPENTAGTPYQSLTKSDRNAYQDLSIQREEQNPSYNVLEHDANVYLEPI